MNRRLLLLLITATLLAALLNVPVFGQLLNLEKILQAGSPSPLPATTLRFAGLTDPIAPETGRELPRRIPRTAIVGGDGKYYFIAKVEDTYERSGIFVREGQEVRSLLLAGQNPAGPNLGVFASFKELNPAAGGGIVFVATLQGQPAREGVFVYRGGAVQPIALQNDPVPGMATATFQSFRIPLNPVAQAVLFLATTDRSGTAQGIYLSNNGELRPLANTRESIPGHPLTRYLSIEDFSVGPDRTLAFTALLDGGSFTAGLFIIESQLTFLDGPIAGLLLTGGGPFDPGAPFDCFGLVSVMDRDRYAFSGRLKSGLDGIFLWLSGSLRTISLEGNAMPGMPAQEFATYDSLDTNDQGDALFRGVASGGGRVEVPEPQGVFLYEAAGHLVLKVAYSGMPAPGMGGRRIISVGSTFLDRSATGVYLATVDSNPLDGMLPQQRRPDSVLCAFNSDRSSAVTYTGMPSSVGGPTHIETINGYARAGSDGAAISISSLGSLNGLILDRGTSLIPLLTEGQEATPRQAGEFQEFGKVLSDDAGRIAFAARLRGGDSAGGIFRLNGGALSPLLLLNQTIPGATGERLTRIASFSMDRAGSLALSGEIEEAGRRTQVVLAQDSEATVFVAQEGQVAPGTDGQSFRQFHQVANSGRAYVAFVAQSTFDSVQPGEDMGLYLYEGGALKRVAASGALVPGYAITVFREFRELSLDRRGRLLFTADVSRRDRPDVNRLTVLFLYDGVRLSTLLGTPENAAAGQEILSDPRYPLLHDNGDYTIQARVGGAQSIVMQQAGRFFPLLTEQQTAPGLAGHSLGRLTSGATILGSDGSFLLSALMDDRQTLFLAIPPSRIAVPNAGFELLAFNGMPENWVTFWTNGGSGQAFLEDTHGRYAFEGNANLRIHVGPGGGAAFVLSDPVSVDPDRAYELTAQMRFALIDRGDEVHFSILEYNAKGSIVAEHHSIGRPGDNHWQWQARIQRFASNNQTKSLRIRFGIIVRDEAYLDVDGIR